MRQSVLVTFLGVSLIGASVLRGQQYTLGPDSQPQSVVPHGTVTQHVLKPGAFYPGTPHTYWIYVPANYDASKAAPFMIFLDGSGFLHDSERTPVVLDNLIAKHDLPPLIGIFIDPGVLPAISDEAQSRYERIFEYDSLSTRFSSFLIEELIPEIEKSYRLSRNPDDRAIAGVSTGAVGAFMTAWNRPDQFHRVLSFIGTYVAMKGADSLPALVRKTEPKPIRVFMQDGRNDHIVPGQPYGIAFSGSWPINNEVMYQALQYGGYDVTLVMGDGAHDTKQAAAILPDALRWLWRGYPQPIVVHGPAAMSQPGGEPRGKPSTIVSVDKPWQQVVGNFSSVVNPVSDDDGNVYFYDVKAGRIYKVDANGKAAVFREGVTGVRALRISPNGLVYASQPEQHRVVAYSVSGKEKTVATGVEADGLALNRVGILFFTDRTHAVIGSIDRSGRVHATSVAGQMAEPTGVALSPDQAMLIVTDAVSRFSWSFQIAADGSLLNGEPFYRLEMPESGWKSAVASVAEDSNGQVYFATPVGVQMCEANGRVATILNAPEPGEIKVLTFAGNDSTWLYVAENDKLFRRPVKVHGTSVGSPAKPPKPPL